MYFNEEEIFQVVDGVQYAIHSNLELGLRSVPTHTEDGIPIRKLYVSNLPPQTTQKELFHVFSQYGFIKSCWLRMRDRGPNINSTPAYAFVTFRDPDDAHKALQAPKLEKSLRGWRLRTFPAHSRHQPVEDADGRIIWNAKDTLHSNICLDADNKECQDNDSLNIGEASNSNSNKTIEQNELDDKEEHEYNIFHVLNRDCLTHVLTYVPLKDLIRSQRVSKRWHSMIQEHLKGYHTFKTSWWKDPSLFTTRILRRVLRRLGDSLQRLHLDHMWSPLDDRAVHIIGKYCPNLEELKIKDVSIETWNPLYECKQLKHLSFLSCYKLTDSSLADLVKSDSCVEHLIIDYNDEVTGRFLIGAIPPKLKALAFHECYNLQGTVLCAAMDTLPNLTSLTLDVCSQSLWKIVPLILSKLLLLEELSLSQFSFVEMCVTSQEITECSKSIANLRDLRRLDLNRNIYVSDAVLKQVAQSCRKLQYLNISKCNSHKTFPHQGVSDDGISAVCTGCSQLRNLDMSYLTGLTDAGVAAAARCSQLIVLTSRGNTTLTTQPFATCVAACHNLKEIDVCGCKNVTEELVCYAVKALESQPRPLMLWLAGTAVMDQEYPSHRLLTVNRKDDLSKLKTDFEQRLCNDDSDDDEYYNFLDGSDNDY